MPKINPQELIDSVTERITLNLFRVGCEKINFGIVKSLPTTVKELQIKFNMTKMPMNKRLNELADVGLLEREKYEGEVKPTKLTDSFIDTITEIKQDVIKELPKLI